MNRWGIEAYALISSLGSSKEEVGANLFNAVLPKGKQWPIKEGVCVLTQPVDASLEKLPSSYRQYECRNARLTYHLFKQIEEQVATVRSRYGAERVAVVLGTSTSGLDTTEKAVDSWYATSEVESEYSYRRQHAKSAHAELVAKLAGVTGVAYTISTACSSSTKAFLSAAGLLDLGLYDAVITGGVDTLCDLTVQGFYALGQLGEKRTNPLSVNRAGLNIGEGGALFVMTKERTPLFYAGGGESQDAYHISAPDPTGAGAESAMQRALDDAQLTPSDIDYINLHGTGTKANDAMESQAVARLFGNTLCSSTKPSTGHCLGASGAVEAALSLLALEENTLPVHHWDGEVDSDIGAVAVVDDSRSFPNKSRHYVLSNSFAFGGSNSSIIVGREVSHD